MIPQIDIDLRWAVREGTTIPVLQFRTVIRTDENGLLIPRPFWSEWEAVPTVVLPSPPGAHS